MPKTETKDLTPAQYAERVERAVHRAWQLLLELSQFDKELQDEVLTRLWAGSGQGLRDTLLYLMPLSPLPRPEIDFEASPAGGPSPVWGDAKKVDMSGPSTVDIMDAFSAYQLLGSILGEKRHPPIDVMAMVLEVDRRTVVARAMQPLQEVLGDESADH